MKIPLDPSADEIRRWGKATVDVMAEYLGSLRERRVWLCLTFR